MPPGASSHASRLVIGYADVLSDDGTRLRAWTNDPHGEIDGPTVLLCNGLGVSQWAWPALLDPGCGVRVVSWNHRGVAGSDRPTDPARVGVEELVEDALSVLDHFGLDRVVVLGWSIGRQHRLRARHPAPRAGGRHLRRRGRARRHVPHDARAPARPARGGPAAHARRSPGRCGTPAGRSDR